MLSDKQIQDAVFAVLRKWGTDRAWDRYTREVGPYDVTELRPEVFEIIRAVLAVADGANGRFDGKCKHCGKTVMEHQPDMRCTAGVSGTVHQASCAQTPMEDASSGKTVGEG